MLIQVECTKLLVTREDPPYCPAERYEIHFSVFSIGASNSPPQILCTHVRMAA